MSRMCFFIVCLLRFVLFICFCFYFFVFSILLTQRPGLGKPNNVAFIAINKQIRVYWIKNGTSLTS